MMQFAQVDTKLADKARSFLGTLPAEVRSVVEGDPAIAAKLAELARHPSGQGIGVKHGAGADDAPKIVVHHDGK